MRFIIAALAAFLLLMFDFDDSASEISSYASAVPASPASPDSGFEVASFADRFVIESPVGSDGLRPTIIDAAAETPASAMDDFCRALKEAAEANEIPVSFFARLIWQESNFRPDEVSHAGAQGVAQFMPATAVEVGLDDPFDPIKALSASARLLRKLRNDFGNLGLAAAAYNAGSGRIQKWLSRQNELPHETRDYVRIITGTNPEDWIEDTGMLAIRADLPREAPCAGIGGLSTSRDFTFVQASPAPAIALIIRKAERAARPWRGRARRRLALRIATGKARATRLGMLHRFVVGHAKARLILKGRAIHLASRERPSS
jgi:hypothetical protein